MNTIVLSQEQLNALIEQKVVEVLGQMGQIPNHITARAAWKICGSRAKFEQYLTLGLIQPIDVTGYKSKRYLRTEVVRATRGAKQLSNKSKKIRL